MTGQITGIHVSNGGVPKVSVATGEITNAGLTGDRQRNLKYHGGPDRAVCLLAQEIIDDLAAQGHPIRPGSTGENITITGLDWSALKPGARLHLGQHVVLEITSYTAPCRTIAASFIGGEHSCLDHTRHPGRTRLYARVLVPGAVAVGATVVLSTSASEEVAP